MAEGILGLVGVVAADSLVAAGDVVVLADSEMDDRKQWRLGLFWNRNMKVGETVVLKDIDIRKPSSDFAPKDLDIIIGKKVIMNSSKGDPVESLNILKDSND